MAFTIGAALLPFYDPIRLAEDMAVLDIISNGRVSYMIGLGYRPEEFEMFGVDWDDAAPSPRRSSSCSSRRRRASRSSTRAGASTSRPRR